MDWVLSYHKTKVLRYVQMKVYLVWLNTGMQHQNFPFLKTEKMKKLKTGLTETKE